LVGRPSFVGVDSHNCAVVLIPDDLTEPELLAWNAIENGEPISLLKDSTEADRDPSNGDQWGPERTIRGEALAVILAETRRDKPRRPVRIHLARVRGALDLEALELPCPLIFEHCFFDRSIRLNEARLPKLVLTDCHFPALNADQAEVRGDVLLSNIQTRSVSLFGAHIGGQLILSGAQLGNPDGIAMNADGAQMGGVFGRGLRVEGKLQLAGARITGQLAFVGAELNDPKGIALNADGAQIGSDMACRGGVSVEGSTHRRTALPCRCPT
jgi:hypothetical protein